jgi:tRNA (cytidine/uridine-2'-O-)-methyltransferase
MLHVVLYQPEIPPNTGNVIRLCANTGARLHLIEPLGFDLEHAKLRRAGLDYREFASMQVHASLAAFEATVAPARLFAFATTGTTRFDAIQYRSDDALLFGPESVGLPPGVLAQLPADRILRLPMRAGNRSLNLSNAVAVAVFEAWRQHAYDGSV